MTDFLMLFQIIRHEWRALRADKTMWLLASLLLVVIGYGLWNGASWARLREETARRAQTEETTQLRAMQKLAREIEKGAPAPESHDPTSAASVGLFDAPRYAALPSAPLAALAVGQSDLYPSFFKITAQNKSTWMNSEEIENPVNLLAGRFDLAFVVIYLLPLLIVALSYNLLSGEREEGTLALLLSQGVPLRTLLWGKVIARFVAVLALVLGFSLLGLALTGALSQNIGRVLGWATIVACYAAFWFALALLVNVWGKNSASNAMTLLGGWLLWVLLLPALVGLAASTLYPVPSRMELILATRAASAEAAKQGGGVLAKYYEDHPGLAPKGQKPDGSNFPLRFFAVQELVAGRVEPLLARYDARLQQQQNLVTRFQFLSPAIVTQEALNDFAGTGLGRYRHFLQQVNRFHDDYRRYFRPKAFAMAALSAADYDEMPRFQYAGESQEAVARRVSAGGLGVLCLTLLTAGAALFSLRRFQVAA